MLIRDANPDELPEIGDIRVGAYLADGFLSPDSGYAPRLRELGAEGADPILVAVDGHGALIGTVTLRVWPEEGSELMKGPGDAEIRALAVRPEARGAGVGRALLAAVMDRAARLDVQHLLLLTQPEMKAAHHLYEAAGFVRLPERDWSPEPGVSLLAYGLVLAPRSPARCAVHSVGQLGLSEAQVRTKRNGGMPCGKRCRKCPRPKCRTRRGCWTCGKTTNGQRVMRRRPGTSR